MRFTKMHGLENDYIYIDTFQERVDRPSALARAMSDRHTGIGADGLILIGPADGQANADVRMRIFNADGGEAQMCGNGIRCVAKFAVERGLSRNNPLRVQTGRGTLLVSWRAGPGSQVHTASVDMGMPILEMERIPAIIEGFSPRDQVVAARFPSDPFEVAGLPHWTRDAGFNGKLTLVSMGNPHAIAWCDDLSKVPLERLGPRLERLACFPQRMNAHFARIDSASRVGMRTWERGSGLTRACGTGACAVVVAGVLEGKLSPRCEVELPGGVLQVEWEGPGKSVIMTGPAVEVCQGSVSKEFVENAR